MFADALALLDELDAAPVTLQPRRPTWGADLQPVPELPVEYRQCEALASIPGQPLAHLLTRVNTTDKPGVLWALHVALDAAEIPPCVRPAAEGVDHHNRHHAAFITVLADLLWIAKRHPTHRPQLQRMRNVLREPDTDAWHRAALWAFQHCRGEPGLLARRLALTDEQRALTMTMPTVAQANRRRALPARLDVIREQLLTHALDNPDGTGKVKPDDLADRRTRLLRLYLLLNRDRKALHEYLRRVDGVTTTLRATTFQLDAIVRIAGARQLVHGPARSSSKR
jgi:hypothetical protein